MSVRGLEIISLIPWFRYTVVSKTVDVVIPVMVLLSCAGIWLPDSILTPSPVFIFESSPSTINESTPDVPL